MKTLNEIISWLRLQEGKYVAASDAELARFSSELNSKIGELNFDLPEGCKALGYAGSVDETGVFTTVDNIVKNSNGKYEYIRYF